MGESQNEPDSGFLYLVKSECGDCSGEVRTVREFRTPVALDTDIQPKIPYCPLCGSHRPEWFPVEEHEIETVTPTQETEDTDQ